MHNRRRPIIDFLRKAFFTPSMAHNTLSLSHRNPTVNNKVQWDKAVLSHIRLVPVHNTQVPSHNIPICYNIVPLDKVVPFHNLAVVGVDSIQVHYHNIPI
jgi:hypothetical protein